MAVLHCTRRQSTIAHKADQCLSSYQGGIVSGFNPSGFYNIDKVLSEKLEKRPIIMRWILCDGAPTFYGISVNSGFRVSLLQLKYSITIFPSLHRYLCEDIVECI